MTGPDDGNETRTLPGNLDLRAGVLRILEAKFVGRIQSPPLQAAMETEVALYLKNLQREGLISSTVEFAVQTWKSLSNEERHLVMESRLEIPYGKILTAGEIDDLERSFIQVGISPAWVFIVDEDGILLDPGPPETRAVVHLAKQETF